MKAGPGRDGGAGSKPTQPQQRRQPQGQAQQTFLPPELLPGTIIEDAASAPQPQDYVFVGGLRLVRPYYFDFKCFVKARQDGRPLMQLMAEEFPMLSSDYYRAAMATGRLRVEGKGATGPGGGGWPPEKPLRAGMCIRHFIHRHEPPVLAGDVQILGITDDFVAVNKPACLPVHTVGQYRKNTVMGVVQAARPDLWPLYPTYRLDKPVSGVLLLARSGAAAARMRVLLEERGCAKAYVARVQGVFPDTDAGADGGPLVVDVPLGWDAKTNHATPVPPGCAPAPGGPLTAELIAGAKPAVTHFRRLSVAPDGLTSVVEAVPKTGRTHQIRVHLQHLGHPIANDTQYGGSYGLPLFFRRGMGGPARPHVNGQRRRHAEGPVAPGSDGAACATGAAPTDGLRDGGAAPDGTAPAVGAEAEAEVGPSPSSGAHKRQRRCDGGSGCGDDVGGGSGDGVSGAETGDLIECVGPAGAGAVADPEPPGVGDSSGNRADRGGGGGGSVLAGPNADAALIAASSERYLTLYTQPEFQVPGGGSDPLCPHCPCLVPEGYPIDLEPLFLHAARYASGPQPPQPPQTAQGQQPGQAGGPAPSSGGSGRDGAVGGGSEWWCFEAPLPEWAQPGYVAVPAGGVRPPGPAA
ncbi:hypothetical protein GPECTOR_14g116 [Gonium pectorale]|uniref:Pseudouridine synthase RsuA/RluA-like domain-containing protein n=1 Tax=Gonium pectorale TaxID=33097 RepID=A0A150GM86_GONPE|nr:hypothetical protein GPECTOR_14g116 [Gonium pectorale]|eukprot:KXZ50865.1 hypothetical protein GPECTOR_14g116 [Gonium pectorale]